MSNAGTRPIVRPVEIVRGYGEIAKTLRTSEDNVRNLISQGAPIHMDRGRPKAEKAELWEWHKEHMCGQEAREAKQ